MPDPQGEIFDPNASKYKCCCGGMDVKTGAQVVAITSVLQLAMMLLSIVVFFSHGYLTYDVSLFIIWSFAVICLIYAFRTDRAAYCVPYIVVGILSAILGVMTIILAVIAMFDNSSFAGDFVLTMNGEHDEETDLDVTEAAMKLIGWTISIDLFGELFFVWIVYKYYNFLRDKSLLSRATYDNNLT